MEKLTLQSKMLHDLMYLVWIITGYYEKLFGYIVPEKASDMDVEIKDEDGITKLYFKFPRTSPNQPYHFPVDRMTDLFNHHLYYDLLPRFGFPKYRAGNSQFDIIESFIVNRISVDDDSLTVTIVYVDNPIAYDFVHLQPYI